MRRVLWLLICALPGSGPSGMTDRLRIIVLGYVTRFPLGGMAWHYLNYVLGLKALGHDVYYVYYLEDSDDHDQSCYDPIRHVNDTDPTYGLQFTRRMFDRVGFGDRWAYHDAHRGAWHGPVGDQMVAICSDADIVINVSGSCPIRPWLEDVPIRLMIDTDPAFEQVRDLTLVGRAALVDAYNAFFTFGMNYGLAGCTIPDAGVPWLPTRQPVVLEQWPIIEPMPLANFTTIMQWDSYESRTYRGISYGLKSRSFIRYFDLPRRVEPILEIALGSPNAPREELADLGWNGRDPFTVTEDPWLYRRYIQQSKAEFSVAKHGYVVTRSGWFSEPPTISPAAGP